MEDKSLQVDSMEILRGGKEVLDKLWQRFLQAIKRITTIGRRENFISYIIVKFTFAFSEKVLACRNLDEGFDVYLNDINDFQQITVESVKEEQMETIPNQQICSAKEGVVL